MNELIKNRILILIQWSTVLLLLGKGLLHFSSSMPYDLVFENGKILSQIFGFLLLVFSIIAVFVPLIAKKIGFKWLYLFFIPSGILFVNSFCSLVKSNYYPEQMVEHALQITLPLILIYTFISQLKNIKQFTLILHITIALTFIGHGCFALGVHILPDHFIEMTSNSLYMTVEQSTTFLFIIGLLDVLLSIALFVPTLRKNVIWYFVIWGLLTSIARTWYVLGDGITLDLMLVNLPKTIYRLPHGLIPLALVWIYPTFQKRRNLESVLIV